MGVVMETANAVVGTVAPAKVVKPKVAKVAKAKVPAKIAKGKVKDSKAFVEKFRAGTIGRQTVELIVAGKMSNDEILAAIKKLHKDATTTSACIAWYKSKCRKEGIIS